MQSAYKAPTSIAPPWGVSVATPTMCERIPTKCAAYVADHQTQHEGATWGRRRAYAEGPPVAVSRPMGSYAAAVVGGRVVFVARASVLTAHRPKVGRFCGSTALEKNELFHPPSGLPLIRCSTPSTLWWWSSRICQMIFFSRVTPLICPKYPKSFAYLLAKNHLSGCFQVINCPTVGQFPENLLS